jgi:hypothetical protein
MLIMPQVLATAADQIGIFNAYALVAPIILAVIAVTWYANRLATDQRDTHRGK